MNRLRTYIARITVIVLVWTGFSLYMVQPTQAKQSSQAFASWLSQMAKSSDGVALQKELDDLQQSADHLDNIIKKASRIVSSNNDEFDFSFVESIASKHLYQLLLIEWSQFQTGNAMASTPVQSTVKHLVPVVIDKLGSMGMATVTSKLTNPFLGIDELSLSSQQLFSVVLEPMVGGIAIGAP
jgi:hypothetical protein